VDGWHDGNVRMPALTAAEAAVLDRYLAAVDCIAKINPGRTEHTYSALRAAQALASHAAALRDALALMYERGETYLFAETMAEALRALDAPRRIARISLPGAVPPDP
jgi:hypothetical protein